MTVFVPSNEALRKIPDEELEVIKNNSTALKGKIGIKSVSVLTCPVSCSQGDIEEAVLSVGLEIELEIVIVKIGNILPSFVL